MTEIPASALAAAEKGEAERLAAQLSANPEYQSALRDAESESWDEPGTDVAAMIEAANERRRAAPVPPEGKEEGS